MDYNISYAQNREDLYLAAFFPEVQHGFYVDVGANHPVLHSVTKRFSLAGWTGINIEPIREHHNALVLDRPHDINLMCGVSDQFGTLQFRNYSGDGLSTFSAEMMSRYVDNPTVHTDKFIEYEVPVQTLAQIFEAQRIERVHFLKVDVEGYEYEALAGNDWSSVRPEVLCIEANHIVRDWHDLLEAADYRLAFFDGLNEYFVADEAAHRVRTFRQSYEAILMGPLVVHHLAVRELEASKAREAALQANAYRLDKRIDKLVRERDRLRAQVAAVRPSQYLRRAKRKAGRLVRTLTKSSR